VDELYGCRSGWFLLQSANNLAQSQKSGKADDKKKNVEYASLAWTQIVAKYQVCMIIGTSACCWVTNVLFYCFFHVHVGFYDPLPCNDYSCYGALEIAGAITIILFSSVHPAS